jgi:hypothetical protein
MPDTRIVNLARRRSRLLGDWLCDPTTGGPLAGHDHAAVDAVAGAGKSTAIVRGTARAAALGARIAVTAGTNDQVRDLATRIARAGVPVCHLAAADQLHPAPPHRLTTTADETVAARAQVVVATVHKLGSVERWHPGVLGRFDVGELDESFQVRTDPLVLWGLGLADRWGFIGDPGQIRVFTRLPATPFPGPDDPVQSVVESSRAQGADHGELVFDWTWRLPPSAAAVLPVFYGHPADAVTTQADRAMVLGPRRLARGLERAIDSVWARAATQGWGFLEHLQTPAAVGGHEFGDWPVDQIAGCFGDDLDARHRHDHTRLPNEFSHSHSHLQRDPIRGGEQAFDRLNPDYGVPADERSRYGRQGVRDREVALALGVRAAVHDSRQNDPNPVIWQPGQDYRMADAIQRARAQPTRNRWGPERTGPER